MSDNLLDLFSELELIMWGKTGNTIPADQSQRLFGVLRKAVEKGVRQSQEAREGEGLSACGVCAKTLGLDYGSRIGGTLDDSETCQVCGKSAILGEYRASDRRLLRSLTAEVSRLRRLVGLLGGEG